MILILSTGRAGSNWLTQLCLDAGMNFGHESVKGDGGCGWPLLGVVPDYPGATILHQWRDPISACSAYSAFHPTRWVTANTRLGTNFNGNSLNTFMRYWLEYNYKAYEQSIYSWGLHHLQDKSVRSSIENHIGKKLNWDSEKSKKHVDHKSDYIWQDLCNEDYSMAKQIFDLWHLMEQDAKK